MNVGCVYIEGVKRPPAAIVVALVGSILLAAGCGGGGGAGEGAGTTASSSLRRPWRRSGAGKGRASARLPGTSDFQVGRNRVSFLVVDKEGRLAERPTAKVWVARGLKQKPFAQTHRAPRADRRPRR